MSFVSLLTVCLGYLGAAGIVLFAVRSAYAALFQGLAGTLNPFDFSVLAVAGVCLTAYALSSGDVIFLVTNLVSGVCNGLVSVLAMRARRPGRAGQGLHGAEGRR